VVLNPNSSVLEAARALEQNRIGAIAVQHEGRIVGIVTDRDLAVRALGRALDPKATKIAEVMTPAPATLSPRDSYADTIRVMQTRNVRRIPLVEDQRVVGMVTLDDLLLDEVAPLEELAAIVQAQIGEGGPADSERSPVRRRSLARAEATLARLINKVRDDARLENRADARTAIDVVLGLLVRRLTAAEAKHLIAELPSLLQASLHGWEASPDKSITEDVIVTELATRLHLGPGRALEVLTAVAGTVAQAISPGQLEDVRGQLPPQLATLFSVAP